MSRIFLHQICIFIPSYEKILIKIDINFPSKVEMKRERNPREFQKLCGLKRWEYYYSLSASGESFVPFVVKNCI